MPYFNFIFVAMIETKTAAKRKVRNAKIEDLYLKYIVMPGAMKSAVVETISKEVKTSITTVNRIVRPLTIS